MKRYWLPYIFAYSAKIAIRLLVKSCKVKIQGLNTFIKTAEKKPCMLMLWHNRLIIIPEILNSNASQFIYTAFISKSRDGDPLAFLAESYTNGRALRVPHNTRHLALSQMIESLKEKNEIIIITPDGPRGPRFVVKPGIVLAAKETGASIFPLSWNAKRYWQLNTWDHMKIPKPFTTIHVVFGEPILIPKETEGDYGCEADLLKDALQSLNAM